jgi:hypothetical protein
MTASTIVCGSCSGEVPYGRLSCPNCGELLASVVGGRVAAASMPAAPEPAPVVPEPSPAVPAAPPPILYDPADAPTAAVLDRDIATGDTAPLWPDDAETDDEPDATLAAPPPAPTLTSYDGPGAYLPPVARAVDHEPAPPPLLHPAGPAAPARAWGGPSAVSAIASDGRLDVDPAPTTVGADATRIAEFVGWLAVAGGALASVGFLLPWSNVAVIGARGVGYFDRWGLAGPYHVVVVVGLLVVLALSIVRNPVPARVRVGLAGGGLAALLVGLAWPYLLGPLGAGPGVLCVGLGAVLLGVASVVAIVTDRRTGTERGV